MILLKQLLKRLDEIAPLAIAEEWDNVGLLVGDPDSEIHRVMTCLTITQATVSEAIAKRVDCIVVHHPIPFKPISQITTSTSTGRYLWQLASNEIAVYSPHTAWDNARFGINQKLAEFFQLEDIRPMVPLKSEIVNRISSLVPAEDLRLIGTGRIGTVTKDETISMIISGIHEMIHKPRIERNQSLITKVNRIAFVCGSGGSFANAAKKAGADLLITGEATYHQFLEASNLGLGLITFGHYPSEAGAMRVLSDMLCESFPELQVWRSHDETDAYCTEI
ncbi:MAG: Nif3-like dinuclear metal center hexameric protein [Planctomycetota bacterium]|nr:Nif3-like dinuclear metal center hexameric protein [Planctomycetota bacterium]